ncbi:hypothetical protein BaRGS_00039146 [Batillaria attramentaria]|uniref:Uncharacterized protein n=1 Tax=Batillaria attramentaria TaxID=370345 RepID=A0ABD0J4K8_9CAEN
MNQITCQGLPSTASVDWYIYNVRGQSSYVAYTGQCEVFSLLAEKTVCSKDANGLGLLLSRPPPGDRSIMTISSPSADLDGFTVRCSLGAPYSPVQAGCTLRVGGVFTDFSMETLTIRLKFKF